MTEQQVSPNQRDRQDRLGLPEASLRLILDYTRDILIILNQEGTIQFINQSIVRALGYLPEELMGRQGLGQLIHPDDLEEHNTRILNLVSGNKIQSTHIARAKHQDGQWRIMEIGASNLLGHPAIEGIVLTLRDVTERIESQQKINNLLKEVEAANLEQAHFAGQIAEQESLVRSANAELSRALRTRDEFLANMSHELRTPLTSILGQAELLVEGIHGELTEDQHSSVQMIQFSGQHLLHLINDILELVKLEAGRAELQIQPTLAETACGMSVQIVQRQAQQKNVTIDMPSAEQETYVMADERRLHQILVNLLSNAIKFTPDGGKVGIRINEDAEQEAVQISVWDTGIGIKSEDMKQLFQPFTQLDSSLDRHHEGTGLGLALVYQLTEMQGGSVTVESILEQGSTFTISLPQGRQNGDLLVELGDGLHSDEVFKGSLTSRFSAPPATGKGTRNRAKPEQALRILLAEDNAGNVETIVQYLVFHGHTVLVATDGAQAIELAISERPDIIIMDMQMPGVDGLEATRRMRTHKSLAHIPVIAVTGLAMPGDRENCLAAGANDYMSKPISLRRLDGLIHALTTDSTSLPN